MLQSPASAGGPQALPPPRPAEEALPRRTHDQARNRRLRGRLCSRRATRDPSGARPSTRWRRARRGELPVSCNDQAQSRFNTTAALLYSFYWEKVDSAVAAVLQADPTCAMAYWAKAVASLDNPLGSPPTPKQEQEGWAAVEKAKQLGGKTPRERDYIAAVETVFKDHATVPFKTRAAAYEKALEQLHARYPEDSEAAVLYAYWLQVTADRNDQTHAQQLKSARILEKVSASQPKPSRRRAFPDPCLRLPVDRRARAWMRHDVTRRSRRTRRMRCTCRRTSFRASGSGRIRSR